MCLTQCYRSERCGHTWITMRVGGNCRPGRNLSNCPKFRGGQPDGPAYWPDWYFIRVAPPKNCPVCDYAGNHDRDFTRMVEITATGARLGPGAGRNKPGKDFYDHNVMCCNIM